MRHVIGMSYSDMAEAQGCPVGTVKAQVSRGIGTLREILTPEAAVLGEVTRSNYRNDQEERPAEGQLEHALADLADPAPADFALRVLQRVGIPRERYDTYSHLDSAAGGLYVAYSPDAVTGSASDTMVTGSEEFERLHHARTGRTAIRASVPFPGLRPALRNGRAKRLPIDLGGLTDLERAVLHAVRVHPPPASCGRSPGGARGVTALRHPADHRGSGQEPGPGADPLPPRHL